jgi:hypothetical protein
MFLTLDALFMTFKVYVQYLLTVIAKQSQRDFGMATELKLLRLWSGCFSYETLCIFCYDS